MSLTIPVTFVDGQTLTAQQLNSVNSAVATEVNTISANVATNTADINTLETDTAFIGSHAFYAHQGAATQEVGTTVETIEMATEVTDQGAAYDSVTTFKFIPDLAGRYILSAGAYISGLGSGTITLFIYKNTTPYTVGHTSVEGSWLHGTIIVASDGNDEFYVRAEASADTVVTISKASFCGACIFPT
jgi:hypothetical protein